MAVNLLSHTLPSGPNQDPQLEEWSWRRKLAEQLMQQAGRPREIQHWTQGAAQVMDGITSAMMLKKERDERKAAQDEYVKLMGQLIQPQTRPTTTTTSPAAGATGQTAPQASQVLGKTETAPTATETAPEEITRASLADAMPMPPMDFGPMGVGPDAVLDPGAGVQVPFDTGFSQPPPLDAMQQLQKSNIGEENAYRNRPIDVIGDQPQPEPQREQIAAALTSKPFIMDPSGGAAPAQGLGMDQGVASTQPPVQEVNPTQALGAPPEREQIAQALTTPMADSGTPMAQPKAPRGMAFVTAPGGARLTVNAEHAGRFQGLLNDLHAAGYAVKGDQSGGYANRNIRGTNIRSQHADGRAVDINWTDNPRGAPGKIPAELARQLAQKHNLVWGGDWRNPDPMHFEVARNAAPMAERSITAAAGMRKEPTPQQAQQGQLMLAQAGEGGVTPELLQQMLKNPYTRPMAQQMIIQQMPPIGRDAQIVREGAELGLQGKQLDIATKQRELLEPKHNIQKYKNEDGSEGFVRIDPRGNSAQRIDIQGQQQGTGTAAKIHGGLKYLYELPDNPQYKSGFGGAIGGFVGSEGWGGTIARGADMFRPGASGVWPSEIRKQIDGGIETLAASIKPLIRKPGEGSWTDADQSRLNSIIGNLKTANSVEAYRRELGEVSKRLKANFGIELPDLGRPTGAGQRRRYNPATGQIE